ncbi:MAG: hypothetical protein ACJ8FL_03055 [Sphingomicrobium sp.]
MTATERARWLAELAAALEQAQQLAWSLGLDEDSSPEAMELYGRLEAARAEVQALRLGRFRVAPDNSAPDWTELLIRFDDTADD